jgi:uncharacterized repeat protein (TIGR01451 family)
VVFCAVVALPVTASAQVTAEGRAFGATVDLLGTNLVTTSDTGTRSATAPGSFNRTANEAEVPLAPLAEVSSGPSSTSGTATVDGDGTVVNSLGGNATARVLVGQASPGVDVLDVVSDGSQARLECDTTTGLSVTATSHVNLLEIAGTPVEIPGEAAPNTFIVAEHLAIITLNAQELVSDFVNDTVTLSVTAARIQLIQTGEVIDVNVSKAVARLENVPEICLTPGGGGGGGANLGDSRKEGSLVTDADGDDRPDAGDRVGYTITIRNTGDEAATNVVIRDRVPLGVTLDNTSFELDGAPVVPTFAACPGNVSFPGCPGEAAEDDSRECFTVNVGSVAADDSVALTFEATVDSGHSEQDVCNVARAGGGNVPEFPIPPAIIVGGGSGGGGVTGDALQTFGSGGCATVPGARPALDGALVAVVALGLAIRRRNRKKK